MIKRVLDDDVIDVKQGVLRRIGGVFAAHKWKATIFGLAAWALFSAMGDKEAAQQAKEDALKSAYKEGVCVVFGIPPERCTDAALISAQQERIAAPMREVQALDVPLDPVFEEPPGVELELTQLQADFDDLAFAYDQLAEENQRLASDNAALSTSLDQTRSTLEDTRQYVSVAADEAANEAAMAAALEVESRYESQNVCFSRSDWASERDRIASLCARIGDGQ